MPRRSHRSRLAVVLCACVLGALAAAGQASAAKPQLLHEFPKETHAAALASAPDGSIWFDGYYAYEHEGGQGRFIGRRDPQGNVTEFRLAEGDSPESLTAGPDGELWFVESILAENQRTEKLARMSTSGEIQEYPFPAGVSGIYDLATSGAEIWFAGAGPVNGAQVRTVGHFAVADPSTATLLTPPANCYVPALGADPGGVWFSESCPHKAKRGKPAYESARLVRIAPSGQTKRFPIANGDLASTVAFGPEGTVWFGISRDADYSKLSRVVRVTAKGGLAEYRVPNGRPGDAIAVGPEGRLWFPSSFGGQSFRALTSITSAGHAGRPICVDPKCELGVDGLVAGPDGRLWFSAGTARSPAGGGGSGLIESAEIEAEAGFLGRLEP